MIQFTQDDLINYLDDLLDLHVLQVNDAKAIVCERGGRILGMFPNQDSINPLWINHDINGLLSTDSWNLGGDRLWVSPERNFFYKNPETWGGWYCPPGLDPADYMFVKMEDDACSLKSPVTFNDNVRNKVLKGIIQRDIKMIDDPLKIGLECCALEIRDRCLINTPDFVGNGWSLTQVVSGGRENPGTVIIPTKQEAKPLSYFKEIPPARLKISSDHVCFKIDVQEIYKLAIRPEDIDFSNVPKIAFIQKARDSDDYTLVVKVSSDVPHSQEDCHDISRDHPGMEIGVIQSYNSESPNSGLLMFGELEFQLNPFKRVKESSSMDATHQLMTITASKEDLVEAACKALNIDTLELF
ncbi:MAG: DUF6786 family protein [Promethearchaeota archaeon]